METNMAMSFEEAQRLTNQKLTKQRKGYLAENAYRQSPEGIQRSKDRVKSIGSTALDYTPYAIYSGGKQAIKDYNEGNTAGAAIEGLFALASAVPGAMLAKKGIKSGYKGLKNLFQGPLSPQYNSEGGFIPTKKNLKEFLKQQGQSQFNKLMKRLNEMYGDAHTLFTGQGGDIPGGFIKNNMGVYTKPKVSLSGRAPTADEYAKIQGEGKRLVAIPYSPNTNFNKFEETIISNPTMPTHGGHEVRIGPLALQKTKKDIIGGKPISFPAGIASNPTLVNQLGDMSLDQLRNWASKNVFSKGGKIK